MQAYQFERSVPPSHTITVELPPDAPTGLAQVIVLFPEKQAADIPNRPRFSTMAEFAAWLETQPPTTRSVDDIERQVRDERESWE
jgi:hypothetical protein